MNKTEELQSIANRLLEIAKSELPPEVLKPEPITVGGFEVEYRNGSVHFGDSGYGKNFIDGLFSSMKHGNMESVRFCGEDVDLKKMELLLNGFEGG